MTKKCTIRCPCCNKEIQITMSDTGEIISVFFDGKIRDIEFGCCKNGGEKETWT